MRTAYLIMFCSSLFFLSCASFIIPEKDVILINLDGTQYIGIIKYNDNYSGNLTIFKGPNGESLSGKFVVVDQTSINRKQGSIVIPQNNQIPTVGGITQSSSGEINATGYWYGIGDKGTKIEGTMTIGVGGHGSGSCKDSKGNLYKILF
jgi:hypothetical protein